MVARAVPRGAGGHPPPSGAGGFTLVEIVIAILITSIGVLGLASIMAGTSRRHERAVSHGDLTAAAESKFEDLRGSAVDDPPGLAEGGSLTANTADHADSIRTSHGRWIRRRWQVEAGPAGTRAVTVRAEPSTAARNDDQEIDLRSLVYVP